MSCAGAGSGGAGGRAEATLAGRVPWGAPAGIKVLSRVSVELLARVDEISTLKFPETVSRMDVRPSKTVRTLMATGSTTWKLVIETGQAEI